MPGVNRLGNSPRTEDAVHGNCVSHALGNSSAALCCSVHAAALVAVQTGPGQRRVSTAVTAFAA